MSSTLEVVPADRLCALVADWRASAEWHRQSAAELGPATEHWSKAATLDLVADQLEGFILSYSEHVTPLFRPER